MHLIKEAWSGNFLESVRPRVEFPAMQHLILLYVVGGKSIYFRYMYKLSKLICFLLTFFPFSTETQKVYAFPLHCTGKPKHWLTAQSEHTKHSIQSTNLASICQSMLKNVVEADLSLSIAFS